jgi:hypothetical protein
MFLFNLFLRIFPHVSTENMPNVLEPLLPFIHYEGKLDSPSGNTLTLTNLLQSHLIIFKNLLSDHFRPGRNIYQKIAFSVN